MSDVEQKVAVGVCEEISEKNGWTAFSINVGAPYPIKLSTKKPEVIEQARAVGGQQATWHYGEQDGNENPNRPGTFYKNRYLNKVEVGQTAEPTAPTTSGNQPRQTVEAHHKPIHEADKQRAISRLSCLSSASALFSHHPLPETMDVPLLVMRAAARFETWVYRDIDPIPSSSGAATPPPQAASEQPPQYEDPDPADDIPFRWFDSYHFESQPEWRDPWRRG